MPPTMAAKIRAAVASRRDPDFVIVARTDARSVEGFDAAVARARAYLAAGADMIFPEALESADEFARFAAGRHRAPARQHDRVRPQPAARLRRAGRDWAIGRSSIRSPPSAPPCTPPRKR